MNAADKPADETSRVEAFFEAVKSGDLARVKEMLADNPELLFVDDLPTLASPSREALAAGHDDVTDFLAREELRRLVEGSVPAKHLYGVIHDLGEVAHAETGYPLTEELRAEAEPVVVKFLNHENEMMRYIALNVLGLHWDLRSHRESFRSMMFDDPSAEVRRVAAACLGCVLDGSRDWDATSACLRKLNDLIDDASVRKTAYDALLSIWFGHAMAHRWFLKVMDAAGPLDQASSEAGDRGDWVESARLSEQAAELWEKLIDRDFIARLERGEEP